MTDYYLNLQNGRVFTRPFSYAPSTNAYATIATYPSHNAKAVSALATELMSDVISQAAICDAIGKAVAKQLRLRLAS